jgi:signal transduction histidine kinase
MLADFNREEQQKDMQVLQGFIKEIAAHKNAMSRKIWHYTGSDGEMAYMDIISHGIQYNGRDAMLVIVEDVTGQQRAEDNMKKMSEQVNELNEHLLAALEEERTYLERQIQDDLAAALAAVKTDISGIESDLATHGPPPAERFARIHQHIDLAANNIQRIISYLRTPLKF